MPSLRLRKSAEPSASLRFTLHHLLSLRLRNPATPSASLRGTPRITLRRYAYDSPPCLVCCSVAWSDQVSSSMPYHPQRAHDIHIPSFYPTHKFESRLFVSTLRLAARPVSSDSLNIFLRARWMVCPPSSTRRPGPGIKSPALADSRIQQRDSIKIKIN